MRFAIALAGAFGFITALLGGLIGDKSIEDCFFHGLVAALGAAFLLRWWLRIWIRSLEQTSNENARAEMIEQINDDESA